MRKICLFFFICFCTTAFASYYDQPADVPNSRITNGNACYVSNPDTIMSPSAEARINAMLAQLQAQTKVEVAVVAIDAIGYDYTMFAHDLFNLWGIGDKQRNTGLLLLFVRSERAVRIETGGGLEGLLPDADCQEILSESMFPLFKEGNIDAGFEAGIADIASRLTTDAAKEELLLETPAQKSTSHILTYFIIAILAGVGFMWLAYFRLKKFDKASNNVRYEHLGYFVRISLLLCFIFPFPMLLLWFWMNKMRSKARTRPVTCPQCGHTMSLLSEQEEDAHLDQAKQDEEKVRSVDYDVWLCSQCQNTIILPYANTSTKYSVCPHCSARTYHLQADVVRLCATTTHAGKGEKTYQCEHCHYNHVVPYTIPRKDVPVVMVGGAGGRGGGGFSSGGSWGGGSSFGGGAGGHF